MTDIKDYFRRIKHLPEKVSNLSQRKNYIGSSEVPTPAYFMTRDGMIPTPKDPASYYRPEKYNDEIINKKYLGLGPLAIAYILGIADNK